MIPSTFESSINAALSGSSFKLESSILNNTSFTTLITQLFGQSDLVLSAASKTNNSNSITVKGVYSSSVFGNGPVNCSIEFSYSNSKTSCSVTVTGFDSSWDLAYLFPSLKGGVFDDLKLSDISLNLATDPNASLPQNFSSIWGVNIPTVVTDNSIAGLTFSANLNITNLPSGIEGFFGVGTSTVLNLSGLINLQKPSGSGTKYLPLIWLKASEQGQVNILSEKINAKFNMVSIPNTTAGTANVESFFNLSANTTPSVGSNELNLDLNANFGSGYSPLIKFQCTPSSQNPLSFEDLGSLLGLSSLSGIIPSGFPSLDELTISSIAYAMAPGSSDLSSAGITLSTPTNWSWSVFDNLIEFSDLTVNVSASFGTQSDSTVLSVSLIGKANLYGTDLDVVIDLPSETITLTLPSGSTVSLGTPLSSALGKGNSPSSLSCNQFSFSASPSSNQYSFLALSQDPWTYVLGSQTVSLSNIQLNLQDSAGEKSASVSGNINIGSVTANANLSYQSDEWSLSVNQKTGEVPIGSFVQDLSQLLDNTLSLPSVITDLDISQFSFEYNGSSKTTNGSFTLQEGQAIKLGDYSLDMTLNGSFQTTSGSTDTNCSFNGIWTIGSEDFSVLLTEASNSFSFSATWESTSGTSISFEDLASALGIEHTLSVPSNLDLSLTAVSIAFDPGSSQFLISATTGSEDAFFFTEKNQSGDSVFVLGVSFPSLVNLSDIPGIGSELSATKDFSFSNVQLYLASGSLSSAAMPTLPNLPGNKAPQLFQLPTEPISQGLSLSAQLDISSSSNTTLQHASSMVQEGTLDLSITWDSSNETVTCACTLSSPAQIATGSSSGKLSLGECEFYLQLTDDDVTVNLQGDWDFDLFGQTIDTRVRVSLSDNEADVAIDLKDTTASFPSPPGVKGLHLQSIGLEMGVEFEPPSVDFGISGSAIIGSGSGDQAKFAMVLAFDADVPNPMYLSFDIQELDVSEAITLFTNQTESSAFDFLKAEDLSFYWCETPQTLPSGLLTQPGFGFGGTIDLFSFSTYAQLQINQSTGVKGTFACSPIQIGSLFSLTGDCKGIQQTQNGKTITVIPAGGPELEFNSESF